MRCFHVHDFDAELAEPLRFGLYRIRARLHFLGFGGHEISINVHGILFHFRCSCEVAGLGLESL